MVEAYKCNIVCPNKQTDALESFHEGHLLESRDLHRGPRGVPGGGCVPRRHPCEVLAGAECAAAAHR